MEVNLNEFPLVVELCKSRLDLTMYQKLLMHRGNLLDVDFRGGKFEEVLYVTDADKKIEESIFHFEHLQRYGFCTCLTLVAQHDTESTYIKVGYKTAQRVPISRVYVLQSR